MAISKKPPQRITPVIPEAEVEALINKGGGVPEKQSPPALVPVAAKKQKPEKAKRSAAEQPRSVLPSGKVPVQLRLDPETIDMIDGLIQTRLVPVSRHVWLMEAIKEKIKREKA